MDAIKKNTSWAVEIESTEGTYAPPASGASFVQVLVDGAELNQAKEVLERNIFTSSIGRTSPRTGMFQASGAIPTEFRASETEGEEPEVDKLMRSALGDRHQIAAEITTLTGNTATVLVIDEDDAPSLQVGDIIMVKQAGAFHVSPIIEISDNGDTTFDVTLLAAKESGTFSDGVVISKSTTYTVADEDHPALSISKYLEGTLTEYAVGCKVSSLAIENLATGQIPTLNFGFEGLNFNRILAAPPFSPDYQNSLPPIALDGRIYMDGVKICVNEIGVSLENTLGFKTCISAENGRLSSRATERVISGTLNPYKPADSLGNFPKYKANTPFSLFAFVKVPSSVVGEFSRVVAIYMPNCLITELGEADQDGLLQDTIAFSADRGNTGDIPEIYVAFI